MEQPVREPETSSRAKRIAAYAAVAAAIAVSALLLLRGEHTYTITADFLNSSQLVKGDFVTVGGQKVGSITHIGLAPNGLARLELRIDRFAPLHSGTTAAIRTVSLTGVANRYVALTLGPASAPEIPDGGTLSADRTTSAVELDQLFSALDEPTRNSLKQVVKGSAVAIRGRSRQAGEALRYLNPALATSTVAIDQLLRDRAVFRRFVSDSADLVSALSQRRADLTNLVTNANTAAAAVGDESTALARSLALLPPTLRQASTTFVNLRATLDDLDPLVAAAKPATRDLAPLLDVVRPLIRDARPTIRDLAATFSAPGPHNDLTDLFVQAPALADLTATASPDTVRALRRAQPVIEFARPYTPELTAWFTKFGEVPALYDANGHYARVQPIFKAFRFDPGPGGGTLTPNLTSQRLAGLETLQGRRCPGGATQPAPDGSAPWQPSPDFACDPSTSPPGP